MVYRSLKKLQFIHMNLLDEYCSNAPQEAFKYFVYENFEISQRDMMGVPSFIMQKAHNFSSKIWNWNWVSVPSCITQKGSFLGLIFGCAMDKVAMELWWQ